MAGMQLSVPQQAERDAQVSLRTLISPWAANLSSDESGRGRPARPPPPDVGSRARAPGRLGKGGGMGLVLTVVLYLSWSEPRGSAPSGAPPPPQACPPPLPRPGAQGGSVREGPPASLPGLL